MTTLETMPSQSGALDSADESPLGLPAGPAVSRVPEPATGATVLGTKLLVAAEAMLLGALVIAYFAIKGGAGRWPPKGVRLSTYLPSIITITAAMSAFSVQWALYAIRRNDQRNAAIGAVLTFGFGLAIVNADAYILTRAGFGVAKHAYGTLFFALIGFHMAHVVITGLVLMVIGGRALAGHFSAENHEPVRAGAILWQFGNVAWVVVMTTLYILSKKH